MEDLNLTTSSQDRLQTRVEIELFARGLEICTESGLVCWRKDNTDHPRNWTAWRKLYDLGLLIFLEFFTTAIGTAGIPASQAAHSEYKIGTTLSLFAFTSMYLFGQGLGGIFLPPYSETFGRRNLYIFSTMSYALICLIIAAVPSLSAVFVGRFLTGALSSIPSLVVAGSIEDMFDFEERIWMMFAWTTVANSGLVVGSIMGNYISYYIGWRWIFYVAASVTAATSVLLLGMKESRPSQLLEQRVRAIRKTVGDEAASLRAQNPDHVPDFYTFVRNTLWRPLRLLFTEPIVFVVSLMSAIAFGLVYLFNEALPVVYASYGFTARQTSLIQIPLAIGLGFGVLTRLHDLKLVKRSRRAGFDASPEEKLTGFAIAAPVLAISLWWFAWTIPPTVKVHWIASALSLVPVGFAVNEFDCVLAGYMADSYTIFSASAFASLSLLRAIFSATFPLFARQLFLVVKANYAASILAAVATFACVSPVVFLRYGKQIRQASKFARYSLVVYDKNRVDKGVGA